MFFGHNQLQNLPNKNSCAQWRHGGGGGGGGSGTLAPQFIFSLILKNVKFWQKLLLFDALAPFPSDFDLVSGAL